MYGLGLLKGLWVTIKHYWGTYLWDISAYLKREKAFPRGIAPGGKAKRLDPHLTGLFTLQYPEEKYEMFKRFRGPLVQLRDPETQDVRCTACGLCVRACPHGVIFEVEGEGKGKEKRVTTYSYDLGRCIFCRLCVESCRFDAIELSRDYELASYGRDLVWDLEKLLEMGDKSGIQHTGEYW